MLDEGIEVTRYGTRTFFGEGVIELERTFRGSRCSDDDTVKIVLGVL